MRVKSKKTLISKKGEIENSFYVKWSKVISEFIANIDVTNETKNIYKKCLTYFVNWMINNNIQTPTPKDIVRYKKDLLNKKELTTCNTYIAILKRFYKWINNNGLGVNITAEVKTEPLNLEEDRIECLSKKQEKLLLNEVKSDEMIYIAVKMMLICALRTIELERMTCDSVCSLGNNNYILKIHGKGRKIADQIVPISESFYNEINKYIGTLQNRKPNDPLFVSRSNNSKNKRLTTSGIRKIMRHHFKNININNPRISCHSLRKNCINNLVDISEKTGELTIFDVANYVRHSTVATTTKFYVDKKRKNQAKVKAMNLINELYD